MLRRFAIACTVLLAGVSAARGQEAPPVDSLIAVFIKDGMQAWWKPGQLFENCPHLAPWQERGFRLLAEASLPRERIADVAHSWAAPLRLCNDTRLDAWFIERLDEAIARGEWRSSHALRSAVYFAQTPGIRAYLRDRMLNPALPEEIRGTFGAAFFEVLKGDELLDEYLAAFATRNLPWATAQGVGGRVLHDHGDRLLRRVADLVRTDPLLADQSAFSLFVQSTQGWATPASRRELGAALEEGLDRAGVGGALRERLQADARRLLRSGR